jgi:uncharacterized protein YecE (DUF72 family)
LRRLRCALQHFPDRPNLGRQPRRHRGRLLLNGFVLPAEIVPCKEDRLHTDDDKVPTEIVPTAKWGYLRLRRKKYTASQLRKWIAQIKSQPWDEARIFFKHEDAGTDPKFAARFLELAKD